jgi:hypothetical protein
MWASSVSEKLDSNNLKLQTTSPGPRQVSCRVLARSVRWRVMSWGRQALLFVVVELPPLLLQDFPMPLSAPQSIGPRPQYVYVGIDTTSLQPTGMDGPSVR